jgi:hypothetical protein
MAEDIGGLVARVVADTEQFRSEMVRLSNEVASNTAKVNKTLSTINSSVGALSEGFHFVERAAAAFGIALSVREIVSFAKESFNAASELEHLSVRLNTSVESLSELQYVARATDVDFQELVLGLEKMQKSLGTAARSGDDTGSTFKQLGIDFKVVANLPLEQQFITIAEALSRVQNEAVRASLQAAIFGRGADSLTQVIRGGRAEIERLIDRVHEIGGVLSTEAAESADKAENAFKELKTTVGVLASEIVTKLAPALEAAAEHLRKAFIPTDLERAQDRVLRAQQALAVAQNDVASGIHDFVERDGQWFDQKAETLRKATEELKLAKLELQDAQFAQPIPGAKQPLPGLSSPGQLSTATIGVPPLLARPGSGQTLNDIVGNPADIQHGLLIDKLKKQDEEYTKFYQDQVRDRQRADMDAWGENLKATAAVTKTKVAFEAAATDAIVGLLQTLGAKHRGAAIAAIAIDKASAIARIIMNTNIGVSAALATGNLPLAATIRVLGYAAAAATAATALAQISQLSSGGTQSTLGTAANPISVSGGSSTSSAAAAAAPQQKAAVQIIFQGDVYGFDDMMKKRIVDSLRDLIDNKDVVIIGPNSRQAHNLGLGP